MKFCWIVELKGRFVAYALLQPYGNYSILEALWVHSKWQRKRIGYALLITLIQNAQKPIYLQSAFNTTGFYTRLGFEKIRSKDMPSDVQKRFYFAFGITLMILKK
ncbi:MAG: GNAT family N-acetyltransferase [Cuspidothrix sp.]